jgi:hypothetical protein
LEFYKYTKHHPTICEEDYEVPRYQLIWHLISIASHVASSYVLNRLTTNIHVPEIEIIFPFDTPIRNLLVATQILRQYSPHPAQSLHVHFHGIPPGLTHHYTKANDLIKYRLNA